MKNYEEEINELEKSLKLMQYETSMMDEETFFSGSWDSTTFEEMCPTNILYFRLAYIQTKKLIVRFNLIRDTEINNFSVDSAATDFCIHNKKNYAIYVSDFLEKVYSLEDWDLEKIYYTVAKNYHSIVELILKFVYETPWDYFKEFTASERTGFFLYAFYIFEIPLWRVE